MKSTNGDYVINGNYTVSPSGPYEIGGTTVNYHRFDENLKETHHHKRQDGVTEWITSSGPLFEPIHLMVSMFSMINNFLKFVFISRRFFHNKLILA